MIVPLEIDGDAKAAQAEVEQKLVGVLPVRSVDVTEVSSMELAIESCPGKPGPRP